jgi:hypothetical protein
MQLLEHLNELKHSGNGHCFLKGDSMLSPVIKGFITAEFEHHLSITLPDGIQFQVARCDIVETNHRLALQSGAKIEHVFPDRNSEAQGRLIEIPDEILNRLPS